MRRFLSLLTIALAVVVSSCSKFDDTSIWDKLNDHEKRIAVLEELCKQMNTNIDALQTIVEVLEKKDYVTNVTPIREDGKIVGYTISFAKSDSITIYNGKDGVNGVDGYAPKVGVMKDTDGVYYWIVDGEWLLDNKGNKIKAIGVDGENGVTPRLKIENDYWYVSYDEGTTWIEQGRAIVDDDTNDGSIFSSVTYDDEYVYFNLTDGSMITLSKHDKENIQFEDLHVKAICCKNWDTNSDGELSYAEAAAVTDIGTVFRSNTNIVAFTEFKYFTGVTSLPEEAFYQCKSLWKIFIPENVIVFNDAVFAGCSRLTQVNIPKKTVVLGDDVFKSCGKLKSLTIPESVTEIGRQVFAYCEVGVLYINCSITDYDSNSNTPFYMASIDEIIIGDGATSIGKAAFYQCKAKKISMSNNIKSIGEGAFSSIEGLTDIIISDNVEIIPQYCFYWSSVENITIGKSVTRIEPSAFGKCNIKTIYCKPILPPNVDLYTSDNSYRIFVESPELQIYVPNESYALYITDKGDSNNISCWYDYRKYMQPYNFN